MFFKEKVKEKLSNWQNVICQNLSKLDKKTSFQEKYWQRKEGGGGRTRVIQNSSLFEKGGVNFSAVYGKSPISLIQKFQLPSSTSFFATGLSIVIHPRNPMIPIIHMNLRYFEMDNETCWFGGGIDLTPHYINIDEAHFFHSRLKKICDKHCISYYPKFSKWADEYFFLKHRNERRGIGGIFFDHLKRNEAFNMNDHLDFMISIARAFSLLYIPLVEKNRHTPYGEREIFWQKIRRGRYVEFNLLWDKGTKFGFETNGRTESILMSMPPSASWQHNFIPYPNSEEEKTLSLLQKEINWIILKK